MHMHMHMHTHTQTHKTVKIHEANKLMRFPYPSVAAAHNGKGNKEKGVHKLYKKM